jgi:hypothetical protein
MTVRFFRLTRGAVGRILTLLPIQSLAAKSTANRERVPRHASAASCDKQSVMSGNQLIELVDCGQVSRRTRGLAFQLLLENVNPPFNRIFLIRL